MCKKSISLRKFLQLYMEVVFYKIVCNAFFVIRGDVGFSPLMVIDSIFPFRMIADGFTSAFLVFFLCIPFLNVLVNNLSMRQHQLLILLSVGVLSVLSSLPKFTVVFNYVEWFCVLYFISSYLRLHARPWMENRSLWGWLSVLSFVAGIGSVLLDACVLPQFNIRLNDYLWLSDSNRITALIPALCFFLFFKNLRMSYSRWINAVASTTFGVLLIHSNSEAMRNWLFRDVCGCAGWAGSWLGLLAALVSVVAIFASCSALDFVRQRLFERPVLGWIDSRIRQNQ